jgi:hypothetical protein
MLWTGFFAGFACCLALIICDHLYADFRRERRERAKFIASLPPDDQKRFLGFESMGSKCTWRQFRELLEIEEARPPGQLGLRAKK